MTDLDNNFLAYDRLTTFMRDVPQPEDSYIAEYVWIGGNGGDMRCKARTLTGDVPTDPTELPVWNYDGSSTNQAPGHDSEVHIYPRAIFKDPFRGGRNILVLCDGYKKDGTPLPDNERVKAVEIFSKRTETEPMFGIEQEYTLFNVQGHGRPFGFPKDQPPPPQGPYYCGVGAENSFGREIMEAHYRACLAAGVKICGVNAEVMIGQWEYQIGICTGIEAGDHMWMSRYLLYRVGEIFHVRVSLDPKPMPGDWNGAGAHTNYSTKAMRADGGLKVILEAVEKLGKRHKEHIRRYGEGNERRLTGKHETASIDDFSWGVGNRGASIRVPTMVEREQKGYLEDRRPASNMDPYIVTSMIFETTVLLDGGASSSE